MFYMSEETPFTVERICHVSRHESNLRQGLFSRLFGGLDKRTVESINFSDRGYGVCWSESVHTQPPRLGLKIRAGSRAVFGPMEIPQGCAGLVVVGAAQPQNGTHGLNLYVRFRSKKSRFRLGKTGREIILLKESIAVFDPAEPWTEIGFSLDSAAGREGLLTVECEADFRSGVESSFLSIYELVVSPPESLSLNRARSFKERRKANEIAFFGLIYEHSMYAAEETPSNPADEKSCSAVETLLDESTKDLPSDDHAPSTMQPQNAFVVSHQLLNDRLPQPLVNFHKRLQERVSTICFGGSSNGKKASLRILSLCSGAARIELDFIRSLPDSSYVELTLLDINPKLLWVAQKRIDGRCRVETVACDVNELDLQGESYDIILAVSALHHVVELEKVSEVIAQGLHENGEFWSIGEYVGRNGNRLWPEAYAVANSYFKQLPEKYRTNRVPGAEPQVHQDLPNLDCSINTFEGIRSEDIERCLERNLIPVQVDKRDCFLWRLFDLSYMDNYDVNLPEDYAIIERAVNLEIQHHLQGGKPTALNGIYKKR
jgi:SAM-dependent methyltransferase